MHFSPFTRQTFNFLGFTHYLGKSRQGKMIPRRKTAKDRLVKIARNLKGRCQRILHDNLDTQAAAINRMLVGIYNYYGVMHNFRSLSMIRYIAETNWYFALKKRAQRQTLTWEEFNLILKKFPLQQARIKQLAYSSS